MSVVYKNNCLVNYSFEITKSFLIWLVIVNFGPGRLCVVYKNGLVNYSFEITKSFLSTPVIVDFGPGLLRDMK